MVNSTFFNSICEPYQFGPINKGSVLTICFIDFLFFSTVVLLALFGIARLFQIKNRASVMRSYTRRHIFELILCGFNVILPLVNNL